MQRQKSISKKLKKLKTPISKGVDFYLRHPEHSNLTEEEKALAIAVVSALKERDHTWTVQKSSAAQSKKNYSSNSKQACSNNLNALPPLFHALSKENHVLSINSQVLAVS